MDSVTYGINYKSPLNDLEYFHVANNQFTTRHYTHLLEGVIPYTMNLMLHSFIFMKSYFTLNLLNERIFFSSLVMQSPQTSQAPWQNTCCSQLQRFVKLVCMDIIFYFLCAELLVCNDNFIFVANQMWNLAVYLPLIIGDRLPDGDEWEWFLILLDVLQICMSWIQSRDLVDYLAALIEMYLQKFRECYPMANIIPSITLCIYHPKY